MRPRKEIVAAQCPTMPERSHRRLVMELAHMTQSSLIGPPSSATGGPSHDGEQCCAGQRAKQPGDAGQDQAPSLDAQGRGLREAVHAQAGEEQSGVGQAAASAEGSGAGAGLAGRADRGHRRRSGTQRRKPGRANGLRAAAGGDRQRPGRTGALAGHLEAEPLQLRLADAGVAVPQPWDAAGRAGEAVRQRAT